MKEFVYKIKNHLFNNKYRYITLLLATFIICIIYTYNKIKPFGNNSMLDVDFYHQYGPLLNELKNRLLDSRSLLYSYNTGGGIPFFRNYLNYLSSPFNIILFLFSNKSIVMSFSIIIALKVIFASLTFNIYLEKTFNKKCIVSVFFSLFYAFSGYFCAYYWNIMWLDGIVFLPLIIVGINKIVNNDKPYYYTIFLSIMLIANYFIAYMICIFSAIYFIVYLIYRYNIIKDIKKILKKFCIFTLFSFISAGLVAFLLLPLFLSLSSISATKGNFPNLSLNFNVIDYLFNHITSVSRTVFVSEKLPLPNVYPGFLSLIFIISFFFNKTINKKAKIIVILALLFFYFSFNVKLFDYVWHAFHVPNDLPYRYSFIYVFCLVSVGYYGFIKSKYLDKFKAFLPFIILILFVLVANKVSFANITDEKCIFCIIIILLYFILYVLLRSNKINKKIISYAFILICVFECVYGIVSNWSIDHDIDTFMSDKNTYTYLINYANKYDNDFYRMEKTSYLTLNDPAWYDYKGISTFSSMAYENVAKFQRNIGLSGNNINSYYYQKFNTPVYNSIFNIKYLLGGYTKNNYYNIIRQKYDINLIKYNYSTSIMYGVDHNIKNYNTISNNPFLNQSQFVYKATNIDNIYEDLKVISYEDVDIKDEIFLNNSNGLFNYETTSENNSFSFYIDNPKKQNVYLYIGGSNVTSFYVDDEYYSVSYDEYYTVDVGNKDKGTIKVLINLKNNENSYIYFYAYSLNDNKFKKFHNKLYNNKLNVINYNDNLINGDINLDDDMTIFSTIAYDKGFKVSVDGKNVKTFSIDNSYLAFDVKKGYHKITISYYPYMMKQSLLISAISFIFLVIYYYIDKYNTIKKDAK